MKTFEELCNGSNEDFNKLMGIQSMLIYAKSAMEQYNLSNDCIKAIIEEAATMQGPLDIPTIQRKSVELFDKY